MVTDSDEADGQAPSGAGPPPSMLRFHAAAVGLTVALGGAAAAFGVLRRFITVEGIAYIDVASAFVDEGWAAGVSGFWAPLYPLLLAGPLAVIRPAPEHELVVVQVVHLVVYLLAVAAFLLFWREVDRIRGTLGGEGPRDGGAGRRARSFPPWIFWAMGYALFLWCSLRLIKIWTMSPDLLVMAIVLGAGALLLRMRARRYEWLPALGLGALMGLGYLAKTAVFPLAFVFLASTIGILGLSRAALARASAAFLVFAVVAAPFVVTLSLEKGRFTIGDSGRLHYAQSVNGLPLAHWQGEVPGHGSPAHSTRKLADEPPVYEFAEPVGGTYPVWFDPSYWNEGMEVRFDPWQQLSALVRTGREYTDFVLLRQGAAIAALLLLFGAMGPARRFGMRGLGEMWPIWIPAVAAFGMYALVHVEMRYLAGFLILAWGAGLAAVGLPDRDGAKRLLVGAGAIGILVFSLNLVTPNERARLSSAGTGPGVDGHRLRSRAPGDRWRTFRRPGDWKPPGCPRETRWPSSGGASTPTGRDSRG